MGPPRVRRRTVPGLATYRPVLNSLASKEGALKTCSVTADRREVSEWTARTRCRRITPRRGHLRPWHRGFMRLQRGMTVAGIEPCVARALARACLVDWTRTEHIAHVVKTDVAEADRLLRQLESDGSNRSRNPATTSPGSPRRVRRLCYVGQAATSSRQLAGDGPTPRLMWIDTGLAG